MKTRRAVTAQDPRGMSGRSALAALLSFAIAVGSLSAASAEDVLSISSAPAADGSIDKERSRFSYQVEPGQTIADQYFVMNSGSTPQSVSVYAADAYNSDAGDFALLDTGVPSSDVGTWVTFADGSSRVELTLQPGESRVLDFVVNVPPDATPGDHAGGIVVSALTESGQVRLDRRIATRLYLRVKGELQALMTIGSVDANYAYSWNPFDGQVNLQFTLTNNGNVSLGANTISRITGIFGIPLAGDTQLEIPELLPGTSRTVTLPISGVGQWLFVSASVDLVGRIDEDAINPGPLPSVKRDVSLFVVPWFAIIVIILAILVLLGRRAKRRRDAQRAADWLEFVEAAKDSEGDEPRPERATRGGRSAPDSDHP